jgi:hypothetical protein
MEDIISRLEDQIDMIEEAIKYIEKRKRNMKGI